MNYCTRCGNKLKENTKFCTKCGVRLTNESNVQKTILILGIILVLFSTFILGIVSWKNMSDILKISFFGGECLLFFILYFILRKLKSNSCKLFFVIGLILVPYTLSLLPYYKLLPSFFTNGAGLHIYLSIIYSVSTLFYSLLNRIEKVKIIDYLSIFLMLSVVCNVVCIFTDKSCYLSLSIICYSILLSFLSSIKSLSDENKKLFSISSSIILISILPFFVYSLSIRYGVYKYINFVCLMFYIINCYYKISNEKTVFTYIFPFISLLITFTYIYNILFNYFYNAIFIFSVVVMLLYFISILFNKKSFEIITLVLSYVSLVSLMVTCYELENYMLLFVISLLTLIYNITIMFMMKYKYVEYVLPINLFIVVLSIVKWLSSFEFIYISIICALLFLLVYVLLKTFNKKSSLTYLVSALVIIIISGVSLYQEFRIINILVVFLCFFIFLIATLFHEKIPFKIVPYIFFNHYSYLLFIHFTNGLYYTLLLISGLTLFGIIIITKTKDIDLNFKPLVLYSEILLGVATLFNGMDHSLYILYINLFLFAISYLSLIKYYNIKWYRILYMLLGLYTLVRIIGVSIEPVVISSIISIFVLVVILTIMFLLDVEDKVSITILSVAVLYPYYNLIQYGISDIPELYFLPLVLYIIILSEIINFKSKEGRKLFTIIPLSVLSYIFMIIGDGISSIVFDIIISLLYMILGLYRKYNYLIYFGIIFMIITILIKLFTILNSIGIVIMLIIIGFILIAVALINELKKKKE